MVGTDTQDVHNMSTLSEHRVHAAACHLYDAECALRIAHQSRVTEWVTAASARLHDAIADHLAAITAQGATNQHATNQT
jgi:hypothetical protein